MADIEIVHESDGSITINGVNIGVLQLATNDKVQLVLQSDKAGADFTTLDFSTVLKRLR